MGFREWFKFRKRRKVSQASAAKTLGISAPRISEWERGVRTPKLLTQFAIKRRLQAAY